MNRLLPTRRLIPRWRKAKFSINQPDMLGMVKPSTSKVTVAAPSADVDRELHDWKRTGSVGALAEVLAFGVDPRQHGRLADAARAAISSEGSTPTMRLVAQEILESGSSKSDVWQKSTDARQNVQALRALLRIAPDDVIALVDLAQHHLAHGKRQAVERALGAALQLSPDSVHVIRAITRYWVHVGDEDKAHAFIKRTNRLTVDPWLMASEIAIAQVVRAPSTQLRRAQRAILSKTFSDRNVSELAAAVGGAELYHGNLKEARKLFRLALERPNDNVLAQAITNQGFLGIEIDDQVLRRAPTGGIFEGRALQALVRADFHEVARLTGCWAEEEPFSSRPRTLQSFVCGALGEYQQALKAAETGLTADPKDVSLRGNKAYALASLGRLKEAEDELGLIESYDDGTHKSFTAATKGMVAILRGDFERGRFLYETALSDFKNKRQNEPYTDCLAFMARTMTLAKVPGFEADVARAVAHYEKEPSQAALVVLRALAQQVKDLSTEPTRKTVQWEWDVETNTLREKRELTRKGAPGFVVATHTSRFKP